MERYGERRSERIRKRDRRLWMHSLREVEMGMREGRRGIYKMREIN